MARTREFDEDEALDRAMHLFWRKGYADTSVRDLVQETGVAHAGLYAAFQDKEGLFKAALAKYSADMMELMFGPIRRPDSGRAEIEGLFTRAVAMVKQGQFREGCFVANTAVEFADHHPDIHDAVFRYFRRQIKNFEGALGRALERGEVRADLNVKRTAIAMTTSFYGMSTLARMGASIAMLEEACKAALEQLD